MRQQSRPYEGKRQFKINMQDPSIDQNIAKFTSICLSHIYDRLKRKDCTRQWILDTQAWCDQDPFVFQLAEEFLGMNPSKDIKSKCREALRDPDTI